jgi:hypothetical protein
MKSSLKIKFNLLISVLSTLIILSAVTAGNASVKCVQNFLSKTVFDPGPVDGAWGTKTAIALSDFANYHKVELSNEINRKNVNALCDEIRKFDHQLGEAVVRRFQINIAVNDLEKFTGRKQFDISKINLMSNVNRHKCKFSISRKQIENKKVELLATGKLSINGGVIKFEKNRWRTGGLADSSYLIKDGVLAFSNNYLLHGTIPYFHLFVSPGEIAQRPMQIDFNGTSHDDANKIPQSDESWRKRYSFYVDTWQSGILALKCG